MEAFTDIIATLGFPIAVAAYALWNSYKHEEYLQNTLKETLKENTEAINKLSDVIDKLVLKLD